MSQSNQTRIGSICIGLINSFQDTCAQFHQISKNNQPGGATNHSTNQPTNLVVQPTIQPTNQPTNQQTK
jgi:hypothetical protein